jgi:hypothetical protein
LLILKKRVRILKETKSYKVWQDGYHAEIIETNWFIKQRLIIHNNPVKSSLPEDYYFSSARNYSGLENDLDVVVLEFVLDCCFTVRARIAALSRRDISARSEQTVCTEIYPRDRVETYKSALSCVRHRAIGF